MKVELSAASGSLGEENGTEVTLISWTPRGAVHCLGVDDTNRASVRYCLLRCRRVRISGYLKNPLIHGSGTNKEDDKSGDVKVGIPEKEGCVKLDTKAEGEADKTSYRGHSEHVNGPDRKRRTSRARKKYFPLCLSLRKRFNEKKTPERLASQGKTIRKRTFLGSGGGIHARVGHRDGVLLPAKELGIDSEQGYVRLMEILKGDEITPEDFELLLQLDVSNERATVPASEINKFDLLKIGERNEPQSQSEMKRHAYISKESLGDGCCLICLEPFQSLSEGTELRCLPCQHVYCMHCIDHWLTENSSNCPNLSCCWVHQPGNN